MSFLLEISSPDFVSTGGKTELTVQKFGKIVTELKER